MKSADYEPFGMIHHQIDVLLKKNTILRIQMNAGHGGQSGRFKRYKEVALEYAFLLHLAGIKE